MRLSCAIFDRELFVNSRKFYLPLVHLAPTFCVTLFEFHQDLRLRYQKL